MLPPYACFSSSFAFSGAGVTSPSTARAVLDRLFTFAHTHLDPLAVHLHTAFSIQMIPLPMPTLKSNAVHVRGSQCNLLSWILCRNNRHLSRTDGAVGSITLSSCTVRTNRLQSTGPARNLSPESFFSNHLKTLTSLGSSSPVVCIEMTLGATGDDFGRILDIL